MNDISSQEQSISRLGRIWRDFGKLDADPVRLEQAVWVAVVGGVVLWMRFRTYFTQGAFFFAPDTLILFAIVLALFPVLFRLTFDSWPFEALRLGHERRSQRRAKQRDLDEYIAVTKKQWQAEAELRAMHGSRGSPDEQPPTDESVEAHTASPQQLATEGNGRQREASAAPELKVPEIGGTGTEVGPTELDEGSSTDPVVVLRLFASGASGLSERIYRRAGVYLLSGVLIAFSGVAFFYLASERLSKDQHISAAEPQATSQLRAADSLTGRPSTGVEVNRRAVANDPQIKTTGKSDYVDTLIALTPRFGVMFFVELVAFFFLRQYREAMDEFRHYEAIKRAREGDVILLSLLSKAASWKDYDLGKILDRFALRGDVRPLASGETTEILEARKLGKDELALVEKMLDIIGERTRA